MITNLLKIAVGGILLLCGVALMFGAIAEMCDFKNRGTLSYWLGLSFWYTFLIGGGILTCIIGVIVLGDGE
jgi:hypothetical protein